MRGEEHGLPLGLGEVAQVIDEQTTVSRVEPHREVVEHQQVGVLRQDQSQGDLRPLSARHAGDALSGRHLQLLHQTVVGVAVPRRVEGGVEALDLFDRQELVLHVPFEQQPDAAARQRRHRADVLAEDAALAAAGFEIPAQDVDRRRLARAVLAQQAEDAPLGYVEREVFVDFAPPVTVCQVAAFDNRFHVFQRRKSSGMRIPTASSAPPRPHSPLGPFTSRSPVSVMRISPPAKMSENVVHHDPGL